MPLDRRTFLGATGLGGAAIFGGAFLRPARARTDAARSATARSIIFMVADGMSMGALQLGDLAVRRRSGSASRFVALINDERAHLGLLDTSAADSIVTDSAAAASGWGTGAWVNNGAIGLAPDGSMPTPILVHARQAGKATGLITTTRLTHATPAGFIANVGTRRDDEVSIAPQIVERGARVVLGGGAAYLTPEVLGLARERDVCRTSAELAAACVGGVGGARGGALLGLFAAQHMSYEIDRPETEPSLAEMTRAGLASLAKEPNGFVVQVEGGRVDHAAHANDAAALVREQVAFDEALGVAMDFREENPDTLLIVTTDHGCANPGLTDYGPAGAAGFEKLMGAAHSFAWLAAKAGKDADAERLRELVREGAGVALEKNELDVLMRRIGGEEVDPFRARGSLDATLGSILANHFAVAFVSVNHTSDFVPCIALGPGAERVAGVMASRELHGVMVSGLDLPAAKPV